MKNSTLSSALVIILGAALTCFLWLPLLPVVIPLVVLTVGARWIVSHFTAGFFKKQKMQASSQGLHYLPIQQISKSQEPQVTAWPSLVSLSYIARTGSSPLDFLRHHDGTRKNIKKLMREQRKLAMVVNGLYYRKQLVNY